MIHELKTRYGTMFVPDTETAQYGWLSSSGASDEDEDICMVIDLLKERPRGFVVDAGASFGCWTLAMAPYAKQVIAFEPQEAVFRLLSRSVQKNGLSNVTPLCVALGAGWSKTRMKDYSLDRPANFGGLALDEDGTAQPEAPWRDVPVLPMDDLVGRAPVSFIKIDTEGSEAAIIEGAQETIRRSKPIMYVEVTHYRTDAAALRATIEAMGYVTERHRLSVLCLPV